MKYSENDKERARQTDIVDFLTLHEGFTFKRAGKYLRCNEHDSLMIYPDRKGWFWNSINTGGSNALDYLEKIYYLSFPQAMEKLIGEPDNKEYINIALLKKGIEEKKNNTYKPVTETIPERVFSLPAPTEGKYNRAFAYLNKTRLIANNIIAKLMHEKRIYQDNRGNVVFVGFNKEGEAKYAATRGTLSDVQYRGDVEGSDKSFGFFMQGEEKHRVYVFESPIDAMSHATLANLILGDDKSWEKHNRLSLGGIADNALEHYLKENPDVREVVFCLDNDIYGKARDGTPCNHGQEKAHEYMVKYAEKGYKVRNRPPKGKDYNEDLADYVGVNTAVKAKTHMEKRNSSQVSGIVAVAR